MTDVLTLKGPRPSATRAPPTAPHLDTEDRRSAPRRKLVIEVSADLHRRIIAICGTRHVPVNQAVREVLEQAFPGK